MLDLKLFWIQNFLGPKMSLDPTFFVPKIKQKLTQNFISPNTFFDKQFLNKLFLYPFLDTTFFKINNFLAIFSDIFFLIHFFDPKIYHPMGGVGECAPSPLK